MYFVLGFGRDLGASAPRHVRTSFLFFVVVDLKSERLLIFSPDANYVLHLRREKIKELRLFGTMEHKLGSCPRV